MIGATIANALWYAMCVPESRQFVRACKQVAQEQAAVLLRVVQHNAATAFGRQYGFASIRSVEQFQAQVPLSTYEDYRPAIEQIGAGAANILTRQRVLLLEPTSGSTAATKYVPFTAALKAEFQRGVAPWITDLYRHDWQLFTGQAYWSVSPVVQRDARTTGGIPIGFADDSAYFGRIEGALIKSLLAVPPLVKLIDDIDTFRYVTLVFLLRSSSLALISVWNPTFLMLMLEPLAEWGLQIIEDIANGQLRPPTPLAADLAQALSRFNQADSARAQVLRTAFRSANDLPTLHAHIWPRLRLVSCWADASAAPYATQLAALLPHARMQAKGLLATEGMVSLPRTGQPGAALAIRSHFFEFQPIEAPTERPKLAHELLLGERYAVILTTGGGFYRYQLHDIIEVVGNWHACPLIQFVGKAQHIADHFGEKLNAYHVQQVLEQLLAQASVRPTFAMVACDLATAPPAYTLYIEAIIASEQLCELGKALEQGLSANYHYRYCRNLGQLAALRVFRIATNAAATYQATCRSLGQRAGNIKPVTLHQHGGWTTAFTGQLI